MQQLAAKHNLRPFNASLSPCCMQDREKWADAWVVELLEPAKRDLRQAAGLVGSGVLELAFEAAAAAGQPGNKEGGSNNSGGGDGGSTREAGDSQSGKMARVSTDSLHLWAGP